jgi:AraC-like DNA-binding protein
VLARDLVSRMRADPSLRTVSEVGRISGLTIRALQRLFREYVGVSPKWVVRRFRLQEAAEQLKDHGQTIASVAAALGYFDQAHFVRDFKACVGCAPLDYRRQLRVRAITR